MARGQSDVVAVVILVAVTLALGLALFAYAVSQQSWLASERARVSYLSLVSSSIDLVLVYASSSGDQACMIVEVVNMGQSELYITIAVVPGALTETGASVSQGALARLAILKSVDGLIQVPPCPSQPEPPGWIDLSRVATAEGYTLGEAGVPSTLAPAASLLLKPGASRTLYVEAPKGPVTIAIIAYINNTPHLASARVYVTG
ncbi:MAG: archaellin/type IV pilin N-terminal domain-containing protein [Acidilobaceae archaeon]